MQQEAEGGVVGSRADEGRVGLSRQGEQVEKSQRSEAAGIVGELQMDH